MVRLVLGNAISFASALFLIMSQLSSKTRAIYMHQLFESVFLFISQIVLGYPAGALAMLIAAFRGVLVVYRKYSLGVMLVILWLTMFLGLKFNTGGIIGVIPVASASFYTVAVKYAKRLLSAKICLLVNLLLWIAYSLLIRDYVTFLVNSVAFILGSFSTVTALNKRRKKIN